MKEITLKIIITKNIRLLQLLKRMRFWKNQKKFWCDWCRWSSVFTNSLVDICNLLANEGKRIIIAGLDMDYRGKPFGPMPSFMGTAEFISKLHAVCAETGEWQIIQTESQKIIDK